MLYEYLLELRAYCFDEGNCPIFIGETRTCWGKDEYDALIRHISKYLRSSNLASKYIYFKLSRLRPTGRYQKYPYKRTVNFFECDARPYIKGLINRFMVRFLVADTEREIEFYKAQFDDFLDRYRDEFPDDIVREIYDQYKKRLNKIKTGEVKPLSFELKADKTKPFNPSKIIIKYSEQVAKILRMFGFRVEFFNGTYIVTKPEYYNSGILNRDYVTNFFKMTPVELIIYWGNNYRSWTLPYEIEHYKLDDNVDSVLSFLGRAINEEDKKEYENKLKKSGLTPFIFKDEYKAYHFYVLKEEEERAKDLLTSIKADLYEVSFDDYIPLYNRSSLNSSKYCVFCGDRVADGDILCPICANNVD